MYKAFELQPHPCTLYNNKNIWLFKKTFFFSKADIVLNISSNELILKHSYWNNFKEDTQGSCKQDKCNRCVLTHEPSIYIYIKVKRWKLAIKWCKFYSDINFFIKKSYKNNYTVYDSTFDTQSTYMISKNCPFFPQNTDWRNCPQHMSFQLWKIWWC